MGLWTVRFLHPNGDADYMTVEAGTSAKATALVCARWGRPRSTSHPALSVVPAQPVVYGLEVRGRYEYRVGSQEDMDLLRRVLLPGCISRFVVDDLGRVYVAYASEVQAAARQKALERAGRFRVRQWAARFPEWMKP